MQAQHVGEREPGVDDVQHDDDVAAGDVEVEILHDPHPRPAVPVGGKGEEVELAAARQLPDEVGEKADAPFQQCDEHDAVGIVAA